MKNLFKSLITASLMFAISTSFAQTKEESHVKLTEHHTKVIEHSGKIKNGESKTKEEYKENTDKAGKHLMYAKTKHTEMKTLMPEKHKAAAKPHHEAIEKYHEEATEHHKAMKTELEKGNYEKTKEHAGKMHTSVTNAEVEHQKIITKTSK